jgi:hypothetical protein
VVTQGLSLRPATARTSEARDLRDRSVIPGRDCRTVEGAALSMEYLWRRN